MSRSESASWDDKSTGTERERQATLADMAAVIERAAADLALAEEPARFIATLEAEDDPPPFSAPESGRG